MNNDLTECPVCLSQDGYKCTSIPFGTRDATLFECEVCGKFAIARSALDDNALRLPNITMVRRAALSHRIRLQNERNLTPEMWTSYELEDTLKDGLHLPTPAQQATNILRYIGDQVASTGKPIEFLPPSFSAVVGSSNREFACNLVVELKQRGLLSGLLLTDVNGPAHVQDANLTLSGWEAYEAEQRGVISEKYGFIALKFGDAILDPLVKDHLKPALSDIGYNLVDLRDVSRAGVIDNILRVQIRDAAFVVVDLTHENAGAYWEAGYAEGLGKPVLYMCERAKFAEQKTHFDTNHCTTVLWSTDAVDDFLDEIKATLRRSLVF
jgi:hypothetical protein